jgi:hypothetical protein
VVVLGREVDILGDVAEIDFVNVFHLEQMS